MSSANLVIAATSIPLEMDAGVVVRVSGTRVTLDTVVVAFQKGATAEEIVYQYPSLNLADVYAAIEYYLQHRPEVDAYLEQRRAQEDEV